MITGEMAESSSGHWWTWWGSLMNKIIFIPSATPPLKNVFGISFRTGHLWFWMLKWFFSLLKNDLKIDWSRDDSWIFGHFFRSIENSKVYPEQIPQIEKQTYFRYSLSTYFCHFKKFLGHNLWPNTWCSTFCFDA